MQCIETWCLGVGIVPKHRQKVCEAWLANWQTDTPSGHHMDNNLMEIIYWFPIACVAYMRCGHGPDQHLLWVVCWLLYERGTAGYWRLELRTPGDIPRMETPGRGWPLDSGLTSPAPGHSSMCLCSRPVSPGGYVAGHIMTVRNCLRNRPAAANKQ